MHSDDWQRIIIKLLPWNRPFLLQKNVSGGREWERTIRNIQNWKSRSKKMTKKNPEESRRSSLSIQNDMIYRPLLFWYSIFGAEKEKQCLLDIWSVKSQSHYVFFFHEEILTDLNFQKKMDRQSSSCESKYIFFFLGFDDTASSYQTGSFHW